MSTDTNNQEVADKPEIEEKEEVSDTSNTPEEVKLSKAEYDKLMQDVGSMKRELKDYKKQSKDETKESSKPDLELLEKTFLFAAQITDDDEIELARSTAQKWGMSLDRLVKDEDFKEKLEKFRTKASNEKATSGIKGSPGKSQAAQTSEYWIAKGQRPSPDQVPDRKVRAKIIREMVSNAKGTTNPFYNG